MKIVPESHIMVIRTDRIGDVILSLPVMAALRRSFPGVHLSMLVSSEVRDIVEGHPDIDTLYYYNGRNRNGDLSVFVRIFRKAKPDVALVLHPTLPLALSLLLAKVPIRMGTAYRGYSFLFNRRIREHRKISLKHEVDYNLSFAEKLGAAIYPVDFHYSVSQETEKRVSQMIRSMGIPENRPRVILHPGTKGSALEWPADRFAALADRLVRERKAAVLVTGSQEDAGSVHGMISTAREKIWDLSGKLSLKELAALFKSADLLVVNSTGPLHMAVAVGTEVVGLFPPFRSASYKRWGPYGRKSSVLVPDLDCRSCSRRKCPLWNCMERISVEQVWHLVAEKLDEKAALNR